MLLFVSNVVHTARLSFQCSLVDALSAAVEARALKVSEVRIISSDKQQAVAVPAVFEGPGQCVTR